MTIRTCEPSDLETLVSLDSEIFGDEGYNESPQTMADRIEVFPQGCLLLEDPTEDVAVGFMTSERWFEEKPYVLDQSPKESHDSQGEILCINAFGVSSTRQGQGLGTKLLIETLSRAREFGCREVRLSTIGARAFYERHGFVLERMGTGVDSKAHVMVCKLL